MTVKNYRELMVWQKAMHLAESVYQATRTFPAEERFGLTSQVRRAAVSIAANIAEGQARQSTAEFLRFLSIANGSRAEVETHILLARRLNYVTSDIENELPGQTAQVARMLYGLRNSLKK